MPVFQLAASTLSLRFESQSSICSPVSFASTANTHHKLRKLTKLPRQSDENNSRKLSLLRKGSQAHTMWQHSKLRQTERSPHGMQYFQATPQPVPPRKSNLLQNLESAESRTRTRLGWATNGTESLQICCTNLCYSWCYLFETLSTSTSLVQLEVQEVQLPHWTDMLPKISVVNTLRWINGCRSIASCILKTSGTTLA